MTTRPTTDSPRRFTVNQLARFQLIDVPNESFSMYRLNRKLDFVFVQIRLVFFAELERVIPVLPGSQRFAELFLDFLYF